MPLYVGASRLLLSQAPRRWSPRCGGAAPAPRVGDGRRGARFAQSLAELAGADVVTGYSRASRASARWRRGSSMRRATPAVLVCVYLQAGKSVAQLREIREATERAARALSRMLGGA
jgi:hypothetical protein